MRGRVFYIVAILLIFNVLTASVGITVTEHICMMLQKTMGCEKSSFPQKASCCSSQKTSSCEKPSDNQEDENSCCTNHTKHLKADLNSTFEHSSGFEFGEIVAIMPSFEEMNIFSFPYFWVLEAKEEAIFISAADSSPPKTYGKTLVIHKQSFRL